MIGPRHHSRRPRLAPRAGGARRRRPDRGAGPAAGDRPAPPQMGRLAAFCRASDAIGPRGADGDDPSQTACCSRSSPCSWRALLVATWATVGQQPSPLTFAPGSLLYTRDGDLYVAAARRHRRTPSGRGRPMVARAPNASPLIARPVAFRRQTTAGGAEVVIMSADGRVLGTYPGGHETLFAWAPDSQAAGSVDARHPAPRARSSGVDGRVIAPIALPERWNMQDFDGRPGASWSPDGDWIAFTGCVGPARWRELLEAGQPLPARRREWLRIPLAHAGPRVDYSLAWAPDSRVALVRQCMSFDHPSPLFVRVFSSGDATARLAG